MEPMKPQSEMVEGPEAFRRFDRAVGTMLSVSHEELVRREKEYQREAARNPNRRGPKKKNKKA
jgi:hypothetical protein